MAFLSSVGNLWCWMHTLVPRPWRIPHRVYTNERGAGHMQVRNSRRCYGIYVMVYGVPKCLHCIAETAAMLLRGLLAGAHSRRLVPARKGACRLICSKGNVIASGSTC